MGWLGSVLLSICGMQEAYKAYVTKECHIGWFMLITWGLGEILTLLAIFKDAPLGYLILNYGLNIAFISVMVYYKRKESL